MHKRQIIREAVANRLKEAKTGAGNHIYTSRSKPLFNSDLPAILIYTNDESIKAERFETDGFGELERDLTIFIEAVDIGREDLDNKLDALAFQIESALDGWTVPNHNTAIFRFKGTDSDIAIEGKSIYGAVRLTYSVIYTTKTHST